MHREEYDMKYLKKKMKVNSDTLQYRKEEIEILADVVFQVENGSVKEGCI